MNEQEAKYDGLAQALLSTIEELELLHKEACFTEIIESISKNNNAVALVSLDKIPISLPDGVVIGALSERTLPSYKLWKHQNIKEINHFGVTSSLQYQAIKHLNEMYTVTVVESNEKTLIQTWEKGSFEAIVVEGFGQTSVPMNSHALHPSEMCPKAGMGVTAYVVSALNTTLRKKLVSFHHPEVAICTNIERKIVKHFTDKKYDIAAYCSKDAGNVYRLYVQVYDPATEKFDKLMLSQTSVTNFVDQTIQLLNTSK